MSELKPCPFCGWNYAESAWDEFGDQYWVCDQCGATSGTVNSMWDWDTRPIEDALHARIAELEAEKCVLEDQQREVKNILIDKNLHIDSLYEEGYKLQQRIANLESENAALKKAEAMVERLVGEIDKHVSGNVLTPVEAWYYGKLPALVIEWKEREE